jgi:ankyrin repeat protein
LIPIAQLLLKHGADADCKTWMHDTPLDIAIEKGHAEIANLLGAHSLAQKQLERLAAFAKKNTNNFGCDQLLLPQRK